MKQTSVEEFYDFIERYPTPLEVDFCQIAEPPVKSWNDFTLGDWPVSVVAKKQDGRFWIKE